MARTHLTDTEFLNHLKACNGNLARTARSIEKAFDMPYSRTAAKKRADNFPELLEDIKQSIVDKAENVLFDLLDSEDELIQKDTAKYITRTIGKHRGYTEKQEISIEKLPTIKIIDAGRNKGDKDLLGE